MATRSTLNVSLTPDLSRFVEARVRSGRHQTASEVGLAQLRRGEGVDGAAFLRRLGACRKAGGNRRS